MCDYVCPSSQSTEPCEGLDDKVHHVVLDMSRLTTADTEEDMFPSEPATGHVMQVGQSASLCEDHSTLAGGEVEMQPQRSSSDTVLLALDKPETFVLSPEPSRAISESQPTPIHPTSSPIAIEVSVASIWTPTVK